LSLLLHMACLAHSPLKLSHSSCTQLYVPASCCCQATACSCRLLLLLLLLRLLACLAHSSLELSHSSRT
jgi:hypothetical protein